MYLDVVVVAGIVTVLLMVCFFVGFVVFIKSDMKRTEAKAGALALKDKTA